MEEKVTLGQTGLKYGLMYSLASTIINLIPLLSGTSKVAGVLSWFFNIGVAFLFFILAGREFKKQNGGYITFGEGFKINMIAASITAVVRSLIIYIYIKFIDAGYSERAKSARRTVEETWEKQGLTEEQMEQAGQFSEIFTTPEITLISGLVLVVLGGLVWGGISAAITKKEEEEF